MSEQIQMGEFKRMNSNEKIHTKRFPKSIEKTDDFNQYIDPVYRDEVKQVSEEFLELFSF